MNEAEALARLPPQGEILRMNKNELVLLILDMLEEGWEHPDLSTPFLPQSRRRLLRFYEALQWPEQQEEKVPTPRPREEGVFGHTSFFIDKDLSAKVWRLTVPTKTGARQSLCSVPWRCAFDPKELQSSSNPISMLHALDACLTLSPLTMAEEEQVRKAYPQLPPHVLVPNDATRWTATTTKKKQQQRPNNQVKNTSQPEDVEDELCLERTVMD